ncbi:hypothetical protein SDC9_18844 [bioreactor metagenome]|uniref:Uncharacterized protein n=1 Tax=bioreactor metagenome TaxID=1076179 RepID=A0A644U3V9_9ZZZZ
MRGHQQHRGVMHRRGREHMAVPDRARERDAVELIEDRAEGVDHAARPEQQQRRKRQRLQQRPDRDDAEPAHGEIQHEARALETVEEAELHHHAEKRQRPDRRGEPQPRPPAKADQRHRRVGAGDQQIDRGMVEAAQNGAGLRVQRHVVARREAERGEQPHRIDDKRPDPPGLGGQRRPDDQRAHPGDGGDHAKDMHHAIGEMFGKGMGKGVVRHGGLRGMGASYQDAACHTNHDAA